MKILSALLIFLSFSTWGSCNDINILAEKIQSINPTSESGYIVTDTRKVYFYSAPDLSCKMTDIFIIKGDLVDSYAEYNGFSSVTYFTKNGDAVSGWIQSKSITPTGTGIGPSK